CEGARRLGDPAFVHRTCDEAGRGVEVHGRNDPEGAVARLLEAIGDPGLRNMRTVATDRCGRERVQALAGHVDWASNHHLTIGRTRRRPRVGGRQRLVASPYFADERAPEPVAIAGRGAGFRAHAADAREPVAANALRTRAEKVRLARGVGDAMSAAAEPQGRS